MILLCAQRERERKYIVFLLALLGLLMREEMEEPGEPGHLQHAAAPPWSPGERPTDALRKHSGPWGATTTRSGG